MDLEVDLEEDLEARPDWALVIVDHGSRAPEANAALERFTASVRQCLQAEPSSPRMVRCAHMELYEPSLPSAIEACVRAGVMLIVVVPFFLSPGRHAQRDIPDLLDRARARHPGVEMRLGDVLGADPLLVELVAKGALRCL